MIQIENMQDEHSKTTETTELPAWFDEVSSALAYAQHVVLSGNVGDVFPSPSAPHGTFTPFADTVWDCNRALAGGCNPIRPSPG